jgi:hypothetical protein
VVYLVTLINGVSAALFHVEHSAATPWHYRWRISSPCPLGYEVWREGVASGPRVVFQPEIAGCAVVAEWRGGADEEWRQAALQRPAAGGLVVTITALEAVAFTEPVDLLAAVDDRVAAYRVAAFSLAAGESFTAYATAIGEFADNVLLAGEEFRPVDRRVAVVGCGPSRDSFMPAAGPAVLALAPGAAERRLFAWSGGGAEPINIIP